ncbi:ABC transporter substrate-binding protein [Streptosporangium sp. NBC_01755]|uniref:ABC transporter substrate-binding protein n=1 Tax=unclassified Streptosporangium TaxID=2632669 RepID=UPI002DDC2E37|nr:MULTISPECIES: ABC transporter substrate-binding protein [unclassified Streptosporangium]WSA28200.1 ABC transporter substrate-binding protein [Streptosporangium sp. NBC_01810]WSD00323.1 ABC transporter substrate-binding protein [Streptosporangium sp. NBC_01755]
MHALTSTGGARRSRPRSLTGALVALVVTSALLSACGSSGETASTSGLKIGVYPGALMSLPAYVGADAGLFKKHGLDVDLVDISDGRNMTSAVVSGSIDIELNSIDNNALVIEQGQPIVAVAGNTVRPVFTLLAGSKLATPNAEAGFPGSVQDLKGKKIGVMATGGSVEQMLRYVLKAAKVDPDKDVTLVSAGLPATGVPALKANQIDAYMSIEPAASLTSLDQSGKVVLDLRKTPLPGELTELDWPYNQWASITKTVDAKRDTIGAFQAAMKDVFAFMADPTNRPKVKEIAMKRISDNAQLVDTLLETNIDVFGFELRRDRVERAFDYLVQTGLIKKPITYEDYVAEGARS